MERKNWKTILTEAARIIEEYDTPVTLRQLFYRLVSLVLLPNTRTAYQQLSHTSAKARRDGTFPELLDRTRIIYRNTAFYSPTDAKQWLSGIYRRDRTEGQEVSVYLGVEKAATIEQLNLWFGDLGIPILPLVGYPSQTYVSNIIQDVKSQKRPAVLIYAGDFDPSGEDIDRDFIKRTSCFEKVIRIALTAEQVEKYNLPLQSGKKSDTRSAKFIAKNGKLVQVELDALSPDILHRLYDDAIKPFWDKAAYETCLKREAQERDVLGEHETF